MNKVEMINVQYIKMPSSVRATHTENEDGSFTIFINSNISEWQQQEAYLHELDHIQNGDLQSDEPATFLEILRRVEL